MLFPQSSQQAKAPTTRNALTAAQEEASPDAPSVTRLRSQLLSDGRALLTTVGNQSNLILDPDLDSYYAMSLVVLRFPELLQAVHDTVVFLALRHPGGARSGRPSC